MISVLITGDAMPLDTVIKTTEFHLFAAQNFHSGTRETHAIVFALGDPLNPKHRTNTVPIQIQSIIIIITKEYDYGGVMSEDCKDTLQTK